MRKILKMTILVTILFTSIASAKEVKIVKEAKADSTKIVKSVEAKKNLYFFMNPNGYPCQMQDDEIKAHSEALSKEFNIIYIKTTVQEDRDLFYKFGIRSLPSIIITSKENVVEKRFSPGIKSFNEIISK